MWKTLVALGGLGFAVGFAASRALGPHGPPAPLPELPEPRDPSSYDVPAVADLPRIPQRPDCPRDGLVGHGEGLPTAPWCGVFADIEVRYTSTEDGGTVEVRPDGDRDEDLFAFATFRGQRPQPMGDGSLIGGAFTRVAQLTLDVPPPEVLAAYRQQLAANDIKPIEGEPLGSDGPHYLSFRPHASNIMKIITIVPRGDEACLVLASVGDPSGVAKQQQEAATDRLPPELPGPPGAEGVVVSEVLDGRTRQHDITFQLPQGTVRQLKTYYEAELGQRGFHTDPSAWSSDSEVLWRASYSRENETLALSVTQAEASRLAVDLLWIQNQVPSP